MRPRKPQSTKDSHRQEGAKPEAEIELRVAALARQQFQDAPFQRRLHHHRSSTL